MCFVVFRTKTEDVKNPADANRQDFYIDNRLPDYFFKASAIDTATATVAPTIGLLPIPRKPIIST